MEHTKIKQKWEEKKQQQQQPKDEYDVLGIKRVVRSEIFLWKQMLSSFLNDLK